MKNINKILLALYLIKTAETMTVGVNNYKDASNSEDADKKKIAFLQVVTAPLWPLVIAILMITLPIAVTYDYVTTLDE